MSKIETSLPPVTIEALDVLEIMKVLPHRYPFLLIDRVMEIRGDHSGIGIKNVTANEPQFTGHFPERPVFPGVLMIEGMAQTAGVIGALSYPPERRPLSVLFLTVDKCKFRKPVGPGDRLEYHMRRVNRRKDMWWFAGEAKVDGAVVAQAEVGAMVVG